MNQGFDLFADTRPDLSGSKMPHSEDLSMRSLSNSCVKQYQKHNVINNFF
jgi:hypothetical protein